jgi:hypothetical protein
LNAGTERLHKVGGKWRHGSPHKFRDISSNKFSLNVIRNYKHKGMVPYNFHHKLWCHKV